MEVHELDESVRRRYPCDHCDYRATSKQALETHLKGVHKDKLESLRIKCTSCDYVSYLKAHMDSHTKKRHTKKEERTYRRRGSSCPKCIYVGKYYAHIGISLTYG